MSKELPSCFKQIQAFAHAKRLSQKDLMDAAKISRTAVNHYFHGAHEPKFDTLQQWGVMFGLNMNWLFFGDGPMFRTPSPDYNKAAEESALSKQIAHLRLVHDGFAQEESQPALGREAKEIVIKGQDAEAFNAQIRLIEHVCQALAKTGASQEMIQRAILALVSGAF